MLWNPRPSSRTKDIAERWRDEHSAWLTAAMKVLEREKYAFPRIPLRRVDQGGFGPLLSRPRGTKICERWWRRALRTITG